MDPATVSGVILWGVLSGILTSVIIFFIGICINKILVPWYQDLVYCGVDLSGAWRYNQQHGQINYNYFMFLEQKAHSLKGTMTITKTGAPPGPHGDYVQGFKINGNTWEGYVTINMQSSNRRSLSFATSLLQIQNRGLGLNGQLCYRNYEPDQVESESIHWQRTTN
jgi:hypothetical protein